MRILVTGGAGYIGSFMARRLLNEKHLVLVVDSLEKRNIDAVDKRADFRKGNILDKHFVSELFSTKNFDVVIHFAGYISMGESMKHPGIYFENNVFGALNVLEEMIKHKVRSFIFSSSAGIYGNPIKVPIEEDHPKNPTNPYGESKLMVERILSWYQKIHDIRFVSLRYFNAAGGALNGEMGENHNPETHIIPLAIKAALNDQKFILYGDNYKTCDGTCVRDYIHVIDLVESHILALEKITKEKGGYFYNVGTGNGYSNYEVINMIKKIIGKDFKVETAQRRRGDAEVLIADPKKIQQELGFRPKYSDLETIVKTAWEWHSKLKMKNEK